MQSLLSKHLHVLIYFFPSPSSASLLFPHWPGWHLLSFGGSAWPGASIPIGSFLLWLSRNVSVSGLPDAYSHLSTHQGLVSVLVDLAEAAIVRQTSEGKGAFAGSQGLVEYLAYVWCWGTVWCYPQLHHSPVAYHFQSNLFLTYPFLLPSAYMGKLHQTLACCRREGRGGCFSLRFASLGPVPFLWASSFLLGSPPTLPFPIISSLHVKRWSLAETLWQAYVGRCWLRLSGKSLPWHWPVPGRLCGQILTTTVIWPGILAP